MLDELEAASSCPPALRQSLMERGQALQHLRVGLEQHDGSYVRCLGPQGEAHRMVSHVFGDHVVPPVREEGELERAHGVGDDAEIRQQGGDDHSPEGITGDGVQDVATDGDALLGVPYGGAAQECGTEDRERGRRSEGYSAFLHQAKGNALLHGRHVREATDRPRTR